MQKYSTDMSLDKIAATRKTIEDTKKIMTKDIKLLNLRKDHIKIVQSNMDDIAGGVDGFTAGTDRLAWKMFLERIKCWLIMYALASSMWDCY